MNTDFNDESRIPTDDIYKYSPVSVRPYRSFILGKEVQNIRFFHQTHYHAWLRKFSVRLSLILCKITRYCNTRRTLVTQALLAARPVSCIWSLQVSSNCIFVQNLQRKHATNRTAFLVSDMLFSASIIYFNAV